MSRRSSKGMLVSASRAGVDVAASAEPTPAAQADAKPASASPMDRKSIERKRKMFLVMISTLRLGIARSPSYLCPRPLSTHLPQLEPRKAALPEILDPVELLPGKRREVRGGGELVDLGRGADPREHRSHGRLRKSEENRCLAPRTALLQETQRLQFLFRFLDLSFFEPARLRSSAQLGFTVSERSSGRTDEKTEGVRLSDEKRATLPFRLRRDRAGGLLLEDAAPELEGTVPLPRDSFARPLLQRAFRGCTERHAVFPDLPLLLEPREGLPDFLPLEDLESRMMKLVEVDCPGGQSAEARLAGAAQGFRPPVLLWRADPLFALSSVRGRGRGCAWGEGRAAGELVAALCG